MEAARAREIWRRIETIHAVTYFAPECRAATDEVGLRGFWMGYFAGRAAPMGPVAPAVVDATFFNFHPAMVRRAIPDAWSYSSPDAILEARARGAAAALRRLVPDIADIARAARSLLAVAVERADGAGRPLCAANQEVAVGDDPVEVLWQATTVLREHRGDGHVALLTGAGIDGIEAHVLIALTEGIDAGMWQDSRGWSADDWSAAVGRLRQRGVDARATRDRIEQRTDELALAPYTAIGDDGVNELSRLLTPAAETIAASGTIRYPNPMGLPPLPPLPPLPFSG